MLAIKMYATGQPGYDEYGDYLVVTADANWNPSNNSPLQFPTSLPVPGNQ